MLESIRALKTLCTKEKDYEQTLALTRVLVKNLKQEFGNNEVVVCSSLEPEKWHLVILPKLINLLLILEDKEKGDKNLWASGLYCKIRTIEANLESHDPHLIEIVLRDTVPAYFSYELQRELSKFEYMPNRPAERIKMEESCVIILRGLKEAIGMQSTEEFISWSTESLIKIQREYIEGKLKSIMPEEGKWEILEDQPAQIHRQKKISLMPDFRHWNGAHLHYWTYMFTYFVIEEVYNVSDRICLILHLDLDGQRINEPIINLTSHDYNNSSLSLDFMNKLKIDMESIIVFLETVHGYKFDE